jgi:hypothetical protein
MGELRGGPFCGPPWSGPSFMGRVHVDEAVLFFLAGGAGGNAVEFFPGDLPEANRRRRAEGSLSPPPSPPLPPQLAKYRLPLKGAPSLYFASWGGRGGEGGRTW